MSRSYHTQATDSSKPFSKTMKDEKFAGMSSLTLRVNLPRWVAVSRCNASVIITEKARYEQPVTFTLSPSTKPCLLDLRVPLLSRCYMNFEFLFSSISSKSVGHTSCTEGSFNSSSSLKKMSPLTLSTYPMGIDQSRTTLSVDYRDKR